MAICVEDLARSHIDMNQWFQGADSTSDNAIGSTLGVIVDTLQGYTVQHFEQLKKLWAGKPFELSSKGYYLLDQAEYHKQLAEWYTENIIGAVAFAYRRQFYFLLDAIADLEIQNVRRISARVTSLLDMALDDEPDNHTPINLDSLQNFAQFLIGANIGSYPDIALTPDGNLFALWNSQTTQTSLQIVFLHKDMARMLCTRKVCGSTKKERLTAFMQSQSLILYLQTNGLIPQ